MSAIRMLSIEIDGHFHGSPDVPRPWVARVDGIDQKYGLRREFVRPLNDWAESRRAWSGNIYGRVARFPLRDGNLYEVSRLRGNSSRRRVEREFLELAAGKRAKLDPLEALARVDGGGPALTLELPDDCDGDVWVARVTGLGTPERLGWVVVGVQRQYRLRDGVYEVVEQGERRLLGVRDLRREWLREPEAMSWLMSAAS